MFDDCTAVTKMNNDKNKDDYAVHNGELEEKCFIAWSPLEENKLLFKHRYVSCSRSVPRRSKRFVRYRISRSLNFDTSIRSSSSENNSFDEDKHLSRSAKIMRALNFNSSPSYYGKTKIKKSLNFNLTPSPKRFMPRKKSLRKSLSMNFNAVSSISNKYLHFNENPNDSANSNLLFSSSESIDENQNETPSQQSTKEHDTLHYSTPNAKLTRQALCSDSFTPLLRSRLTDSIDNIVYVSATPNSQSFERVKGRSKCANGIALNTSRNLFYEFHDKEDDRPCTPENVICIIPESMSAIKRSHKKERSSRRNEHCSTTQYTNNIANDECILQNNSARLLSRHRKSNDLSQDYESNVDRYRKRNSDSNEPVSKHSEGDMSDTGSLFDYMDEQEEYDVEKEERKETLKCLSNYTDVPNVREVAIKKESEGSPECFSAIGTVDRSLTDGLVEDYSDADESGSAIGNIVLVTKVRSVVTPEPMSEMPLDSQKTVTPENRINILQRVANESIKKSHKKTKDNNRRRLFSPKVLRGKLDVAENQENANLWQNFDEHENVEEEKAPVEQNYCIDAARGERSCCTPQKLNSSRLLLSQFSSVKKSHKKDKHNNILSGFLKRQEYFNKDVDTVKGGKNEISTASDVSERRNSAEDLYSDLDTSTNIADYSTSSGAACDADDDDDTNTSLDKVSPIKRKKALNRSLVCTANVSSDDSKPQELDTSKEEFKIYTPLKRKRSVIASSVAKEYFHSYDLPSDKSDLSEDVGANISFSRCLTPVPKFQSVYLKTEEDADSMTTKSDENVSFEGTNEVDERGLNDVTGRSTPRDMSTAELYVNLDSIKKSHKKNKRGNSLRKGLSFVKDNLCADTPMEYIDRNVHSPVEFVHDRGTEYDKNIISKSIGGDGDGDSDSDSDSESEGEGEGEGEKSVDESNVVVDDGSGRTAVDSEKRASTGMENARSNVTPPNCLKTKNYMRLLRETSIKRSHKKVRDRRKQEYNRVDANELSDDGSLFGDEGKFDFAEN